MFGHLIFGMYLKAWSTPLSSMVVIQKLFLPIDLMEIMEDTMTHVHYLAILYFFANFLLSLIICNLSLSIVIDWYSDSLNNFNELFERERAYENVFKAIYSRVRRRDRDNLNYDILKDYIMVKNDQSDHRAKFLKGEESFNESDLKQCQKYANIDLIELYKREKKKSNALQWEETFVSRLKDSKPRVIQLNMKESLYQLGEKAENCFILINGIASCFLKDEQLELTKCLDFTAVSVLGSEAIFESNGVYQENCVAAVESVECIVLSRNDILEELDPALVGTILRLAQKTKQTIQQKLL